MFERVFARWSCDVNCKEAPPHSHECERSFHLAAPIRQRVSAVKTAGADTRNYERNRDMAKRTGRTFTTTEREVYVARADAKAAKVAKATSPFTITVVFLGGLTTAQKNAFKAAADRWSKVIVGDLPNVVINGQLIDDVLIEASGTAIDGIGGILGQAGPTHLRPAGAG